MSQLRAFVDHLALRCVVADAMGVRQGPVAFLSPPHGCGEQLILYIITPVSKAQRGSAYLGVIETGRFQSYADGDDDRRAFFREAEYCAYQVPEGEGALDRRLRSGVPDEQRDAATGELVHDDRLVAAALVAVLDDQPWTVYRGGGTVTNGRTVAQEFVRGGF